MENAKNVVDVTEESNRMAKVDWLKKRVIRMECMGLKYRSVGIGSDLKYLNKAVQITAPLNGRFLRIKKLPQHTPSG